MTRRFAHIHWIWPLLAFCLVSATQAQNDEEDAFKLARNLFRDAHDYATAAELFAEFIRNYPDSQHLAEARLMLARSYKNSGRCREAIATYESFYQEYPDHLETAAARRERADCLAAEGKHLEAAQAYEEVQRRFSASEFAAQVLLDAAANYTSGGEPEQAIRAYRKVIAEYGRQPQVYAARYRLAKLLFAKGRSEEAQQLLAEIAEAEPPAPEAASALLLSGRIDLFLGDKEAADQRFALLQKRFPASAQADSARLEQADYLYLRRQFAQASDAYRTAHQQIRDSGLKKRALLGLAEALRQSHQTSQALRCYQDLLKDLPSDHPDYFRARLGLAVAYGQAGRFALAVGLFQELIQSGSNQPEAVSALRELARLYQSRGDHARAISWYRRYLQKAEQASDRNQVEFALAHIYAETGDYEEATTIYRRLAERPVPLAVEAQFELARTFEREGLLRPALREYLVLLEQFPASQRAQAARERVEYLREFSVLDPDALSQALQQAWLDELSGRPRQLVELNVAHALYDHHDFANAVRAFEHYAAAYQGESHSAQAQYFLAESLHELARQRQLEDRPQQADSLYHLALQEYRILARAGESEWSRRAELQLIDLEADTAPDSLRPRLLESGFARFLDRYPEGPLAARALLGLAEARRRLSRFAEATQLYRKLRDQYADSPLAAQALFGLALCRAQMGDDQAAADSLEQLLASYPDNPMAPQVLFELGRLLLRQGKLRDAVTRYQELLWAYPAFPQRRAVQLMLADTFYRLEEYGQAIALYRQLLDGRKAGGQAGYIRRRLAQAYHRKGDFSQALESYRELLAEDPAAAGRDSIYFSQAILLVQLHQEEEAIRSFLKVKETFPNSPLAAQAAARAAHLLFALGRYDQAYRLYQPLLSGTPDPEVYGRAVLALFRMDRLAEARKELKRFTKRLGKDPKWLQRFQLEEGEYYLRRKEYERALKRFRKLEKQGGEWADDAAYYAALALWRQNEADPSPESASRALEAQSRFIEQYPDSPHASDVYLRLGNYHYSLRNYLQAAGAYKRVLERPANQDQAQEAIWKLLESYMGAHEYDEAHKVAEQLLQRFPGHPKKREAELEIGIILKEKGQYAQAIAQFEKVLEWAEGNQASEARFYIGESYQNMGEYRKAIEAYYRVSFHGGGFSQWITSADYKRAQCHESLGEYATAIAVYQRIVQREGSDSPQGELASERIQILRRRLEER